MITSGIIVFIYYFITGLISLLPDSSGLPASVLSSFESMVAYAKSFEFILPINTLFTVFNATIVFFGIEFLWHILHWIYRKVRKG